MEVQFNKNSSDATIVTGPVTIVGMVAGFLLSGFIISKYRPSPRKLFFWNVIVGVVYMMGQGTYITLTCDNNSLLNEFGALNLTASCNSNCFCDSVQYSPVCHEASGTTYFSPCHAGCGDWNETTKTYHNCKCATDNKPLPWEQQLTTKQTTGAVKIVQQIDTTTIPATEILDITTTQINFDETTSNETSDLVTKEFVGYDEVVFEETMFPDNGDSDYQPTKSAQVNFDSSMIPGACLSGCAYGFYMFTGISLLINCFGATGRIGNIILNFRYISGCCFNYF